MGPSHRAGHIRHPCPAYQAFGRVSLLGEVGSAQGGAQNAVGGRAAWGVGERSLSPPSSRHPLSAPGRFYSLSSPRVPSPAHRPSRVTVFIKLASAWPWEHEEGKEIKVPMSDSLLSLSALTMKKLSG